MSLEAAIQHVRNRFAHNGQFSLRPKESINDVVRREKIPNLPGIYICFRCDDLERPLYIGKSGTMRTDGTFKDAGLGKRLTRKQGKTYRRKYFCKLMEDRGLSGLTFFWFVTHDQGSRIIPGLAEMELLQAHYDQYGCLPELNKCV